MALRADSNLGAGASSGHGKQQAAHVRVRKGASSNPPARLLHPGAGVRALPKSSLGSRDPAEPIGSAVPAVVATRKLFPQVIASY
jgi:hypothetical protein